MEIRVFLLVFIVGFPLQLQAQKDDAPFPEEAMAVFSELFNAEEPLHMTLEFDANKLRKTRRKDIYHDALMNCEVENDFSFRDSVRLKARGIYRRDYCTMPPIWFNIRHACVRADSLEDVIRMKLVVRCRDQARYEPYVLREYLAYKIYNMITPLSYRVRLVRLTIIDKGKKNEVTEDWAFLQEPDELMTLRLGGKMIKSDELSMARMNPEAMDRMALYSYMIGNGDYSVTGRHNLKIMVLNSGDPSGFLPVPYDFDFTGLVNTIYATPREDLAIRTVRDRCYLGQCRPRQTHEKTIQELAQCKDGIMQYIKDFEYLDEEEKADMIDYLQSYFEQSAESWFIDRCISSTCR